MPVTKSLVMGHNCRRLKNSTVTDEMQLNPVDQESPFSRRGFDTKAGSNASLEEKAESSLVGSHELQQHGEETKVVVGTTGIILALTSEVTGFEKWKHQIPDYLYVLSRGDLPLESIEDENLGVSPPRRGRKSGGRRTAC